LITFIIPDQYGAPVKKFVAPLGLSIVLAAGLMLASSGPAQASTDPGGGGSNPCNMSLKVTPTSGKLSVTFTLLCSEPMGVLSHGVTVSDETKNTSATGSDVCRLVPANTKCSKTVTIANPSGTQKFSFVDEYYTTFYTVDEGLHTFIVNGTY
jgi:hypothetical protein